MASFTCSQIERVDGVTVLTTLEETEITAGATIVVASVGNGMDGTYKVIATTPYAFTGVSSEGDLEFDYDVLRPNQVLYANSGSDISRRAATAGTISYTPTCTWVSVDDVAVWLGLDYTDVSSLQFLEGCVDAANAFAYRRRRSARYSDSLTLVPDGAVRQGTIMYASALFRERGSLDSFQSFDAMQLTAPTGSMGQILRLLGCNRAAVG